jgi:hypothetical protein
VSTTALPKSGCFKSKSASPPTTKRCGKNPMLNVLTSSAFFESECESHTTTASLASSAG